MTGAIRIPFLASRPPYEITIDVKIAIVP